MSARAGWYPDPGGGQNLYRFWDGKAWSAATSPNPQAPAPSQGLVGQGTGGPPVQPELGQQGEPYGGYGQQGAGQQAYGQQGLGGTSAYTSYQQTQKRKSPVGWWIGAAALVVVIVVVGVLAVRAIGGAGGGSGPLGGQPSADVCPPETTESTSPAPRPNDGRVHGGPVSYPELGPPWGAPQRDDRLPYGSDVLRQDVPVEPNYDPPNSWVASILVGELQAGDGFFTPEQGSQIVVRCIIGRYYSDAEVRSDVRVNRAITIDGQQGWLVESQLSFDIPNLETKGELLIVAIVSTGATAGLYYASIPDTTPELVQPARDALRQLQVDG